MLYNGDIIDAEMTSNANGGTEMMRRRLQENVPRELLKNTSIYFSRIMDVAYNRNHYNIMYCHDLPEDSANGHLRNGGIDKFDMFVFVSYWQRDMYMAYFNIPFSKTKVIHNAIETMYDGPQPRYDEVVKFIYHTTPHRGLVRLYDIFNIVSRSVDVKIELDVYSSFEVYGWGHRDKPYMPLFEKIKESPIMNYMGARPNEEILAALKKSHYFLYPCIWKETSCIAAIEAIKSGVDVIHPAYGALTELGLQANTYMYEMSENMLTHMDNAINMTLKALNEKVSKQTPLPESYDIPHFKKQWVGLLTNKG